MPKRDKEYQPLLPKLSFDASFDKSIFAWDSIFKLNYGDFKVESVSGQCKGAFQPLGDMAKDFVDTFKPYRSSWYVKRDALQPLYGIINLLYGIAHLVLLVLMFLIYPIVLCFKVKSPRDYAEKLGHFYIGLASWLIYGVLMLIRGATRIAATPLMLIKMALRGLNTVVRKYFWEEKFLAETDASLQAKVKVASRLLETQAQKLRQYKRIEMYPNGLPEALVLTEEVLYLVKTIEQKNHKEKEVVTIHRLNQQPIRLSAIEKLTLCPTKNWSAFSENPELIQRIAWKCDPDKVRKEQEIFTEIDTLHAKYDRLTYKKKLPTQLGYSCDLVLAEDNLPTGQELIQQKKKVPLLIQLKNNHLNEISFYICGLGSTGPKFTQLNHTNELETLDFSKQSKVLISPQHCPMVFKEIHSNKNNFGLETQEEVAYTQVKDSSDYRFSTKANAYLQLFALPSKSAPETSAKKEIKENSLGL